VSEHLFTALIVAGTIVGILLAGAAMGAIIGYQRGRNAHAKEMLERRRFG
jgi:hypothetical protein